MTTLDQLPKGVRAKITAISGEPALVQRFLELGVMEGEDVEIIALAPLGDPIEILCGHSRLSLRCCEAAGIHVSLLSNPKSHFCCD